MCLYDIWLPSGSLQRKLLTLCITPQRSGLSVMYNPQKLFSGIRKYTSTLPRDMYPSINSEEISLEEPLDSTLERIC